MWLVIRWNKSGHLVEETSIEIHSAWEDEQDAKDQVDALKDNGYEAMRQYCKCLDGVAGTYFV